MVSRCNALPKKVPKRIIQKKRQQQIRDEDVSFILSFIYWVQQPLYGWGSFSWIHWNGWIPQIRCQNTLIVFMYVWVRNLVFRASIRVSFLLEVCQSPVRVSLWFSSGSCIFQHNADRERAATGGQGLTNATSKDVCVVPRHQKATMLSKRWSLPEREWIAGLLCHEECLFSFTHTSPPFPVRDLWSFCKFNSFLLLFFLNLILNLIYLSIRSLRIKCACKFLSIFLRCNIKQI